MKKLSLKRLQRYQNNKTIKEVFTIFAMTLKILILVSLIVLQMFVKLDLSLHLMNSIYNGHGLEGARLSL